MSSYHLIEILIVGAVVAAAAIHAWRNFAPQIRRALGRANAEAGDKAASSACGGCSSCEPGASKTEIR